MRGKVKMTEVFDSEIKKIEDEIIEYLLNSAVFAARGKITSKILFYFITRKNLSQIELQRLTGYSAGKISQELNDFVELDLVKISKKSKPWIYSMKSIVTEMFSRGINLLKINLRWEPQFLEIKKELEDNQAELQKLNGYDKVKDFLEENLTRFAGFKIVLKLWEDLKKKYEKK